MTEKEKKATIQRATADAHRILKAGADRAAGDIVRGLRPLSAQGALAAEMMVARGIPVAEAVRAAARVTGHQFMMTRLSPVGQDAASISPAPTQVTLNRLRGEF